ncbi:hypothetical protein [Microbulbifer variabilis]|uniref:hypothetical protein n=1 Tax=Microbulbifer variabilis TaxID=266805 RepID=UPI001CFD235F|nr:hypothetical protein [Microbulbifer variabilis]
MLRYFLVAPLLLILASCGRPEVLSGKSAEEATPGSEKIVVEFQEGEEHLLGPDDSSQISSDEILNTKDDTEIPVKQHNQKTDLAIEEGLKPIDISAAFEEGVSSGEKYDFSRKNTLPNLFEKQHKDENVSFSGKLINDPENPDYLESLDGAEFSIEIKTR